MKFKVMGVTAGRKNSNSEILLKEALSVCQEQGAEITMINLRDYDLLDCTGCTSCTIGMSTGKYTGCALADKDDKHKIMEVLLDQDAVIFSAPTYALMPSSLFSKFMHRNLAYESAFLAKIGAVRPHDRVGALIAVGGSTRSWQSLSLECMQITTVTNSFRIVDMYMATEVVLSAVLRPRSSVRQTASQTAADTSGCCYDARQPTPAYPCSLPLQPRSCQ